MTGAAGYIGGWLCAELDRRGHEVHAQDLVKPACTRETEHWATFRTFDLCSQERIDWLRTVEPEAVIHLAALYGRVWGEVDMVKTAGINAGLTAMLARDCASFGARLMFMSLLRGLRGDSQPPHLLHRREAGPGRAVAAAQHVWNVEKVGRGSRRTVRPGWSR